MFVTSDLGRCKERRVILYFVVKLRNDCWFSGAILIGLHSTLVSFYSSVQESTYTNLSW